MVTNSNNSTISKNVRNKKRGIVNNILYTPPNMRRQIPKSVSDSAVFKKRQYRSTIDVWWLYDDGGLTMLIPYIISLRHDWSQCRMRVFALANNKNEIETEHKK